MIHSITHKLKLLIYDLIQLTHNINITIKEMYTNYNTICFLGRRFV